MWGRQTTSEAVEVVGTAGEGVILLHLHSNGQGYSTVEYRHTDGQHQLVRLQPLALADVSPARKMPAQQEKLDGTRDTPATTRSCVEPLATFVWWQLLPGRV
jgi:hypothetical protein